MRVLITGVGGFVGFHLAKHLAERSATVLGLGMETAPARTAALLAAEWRTDVCDLEGVEAALREGAPDAVVHLAAQSSAAWSFDQPARTFEINVLGTVRLLEAVRRAASHARVLVVGTGDAYGPQIEGTRVSEDAGFRPTNPYALSKATADGIAEMCGRMWDLDVVRTRSFGHLGPGQETRFAVPSWCRQIAEIETSGKEPILRVGNLDVTRDLTDVRDIAEAYARLLERGRSGVAYNVCAGVGTRLRAVAESLCERSHVSVRVVTDPARVRAADIPYLVGDPARIHQDIGWSATVPLERTLDETLEDWRSRVKTEETR